jgi:hypothetical protein
LCGWHFISAESLQEHLGETCSINNHKKKQLIFGLEGNSEPRASNSPGQFSTGVDGRLSLGSDIDSPKVTPVQFQGRVTNKPITIKIFVVKVQFPIFRRFEIKSFITQIQNS